MISLLKKETNKLFQVFANPTFIYLTVAGNTVLFSATTIVYFLERGSNAKLSTFFDCLWWAISTITTVAYGDRIPQTFPGRLIAIGLMYTGTVLFITFTGVILNLLMREEVIKDMEPIEKEMKETNEDQIKIQKMLELVLHRLEKLEKDLLKNKNM